MRHIEIRKCQISDFETIVQLETDWELENITHGFFASSLDDLQNDTSGYFFVANCDGQIIGFIRGSEHVSDGLAVIPENEKYLEIDDVYVVPEFRSEGVGRRLIEHIKALANENDIHRFLVYSATKDLDKIVKFYRNTGFESWCVQMFI